MNSDDFNHVIMDQLNSTSIENVLNHVRTMCISYFNFQDHLKSENSKAREQIKIINALLIQAALEARGL